MTISVPEALKPVVAYAANRGLAGAIASRYFSMKNLHRGYFIISYRQADADDQQWNLMRATAVAPVGNVVVVVAQRIWSNLDCATNDRLVERTAAVNYASGAGQAQKLIIFEVDPSKLGDGFDCVGMATQGNVAATSHCSIEFIGIPRYPSRVETQPSIVID